MDERDEEFWQEDGPESQPARNTADGGFARMTDIDIMRHNEAEEPMTLGESVTLLIAIGVLLYLIYALLWPERF